MTLKQLIEEHNLKVGDKVRQEHWSEGRFEIILFVGQKLVLTNNDIETEAAWNLDIDFCWKLYFEPKVPLTLDCEVEWLQTNKAIIYPIGTKEVCDKFTPFIGKKTRMILTEIIE